jgi:hypothetical protein
VVVCLELGMVSTSSVVRFSVSRVDAFALV